MIYVKQEDMALFRQTWELSLQRVAWDNHLSPTKDYWECALGLNRCLMSDISAGAVGDKARQLGI